MNQRILFMQRPKGLPNDSTWKIESVPIPKINEGEVLVKNVYISLDPAMRGWMRDVRSYVPPVKIGEVMRALTVGQVVQSKSTKYPKGEWVIALGGWQEYVVVAEKDKNMQKAIQIPGVPLSHYLGSLGITGLTAYFGLIEVGKPKSGDVVFVSGAAGAVGSIVGQISKILGCYVVGTAGSDEKCKYLKSLGYDAAVNYKNYPDTASLSRALYKATGGKRVNVYFDNVGGYTLEAALNRLAPKARVSICGAISQYNVEGVASTKGPANYLSLLVNRATMEGFVYFDYKKKFPEAIGKMVQWMKEGRLQAHETRVKGLTNAPAALLRLFSGKKTGKLVIELPKPVLASL